MNHEQDSRLVRGILAGDKELFSSLVKAYHGPIYNLALRMTGSPADAADLTQETFVRAWIKLDSFDEDSRFYAWLYTLSLNLIRNHLKKKSSARHQEYCPERTRLENSPGSDPPQELIFSQNEQQIQNLLLCLPLEQREALLLRFFSEVPYREMTHILGVSESCAKMRVSRGLKTLREMMPAEFAFRAE